MNQVEKYYQYYLIFSFFVCVFCFVFFFKCFTFSVNCCQGKLYK